MGDSGGSILGSNGLLGCSFMPGLLLSIYIYAYKWAPGAVFWCFEALETWPGRVGFTPTNSQVEWASRMPVRARFTI